MVKPESDVIKEFNELVNMTPQELEDWLKTEDSQGAGWHNPDSAVGEGKGGEAVGHESGRQIIQILKSNPEKKPDGYGKDDVEHMRRVVSYCKRHKAGESSGNSSKSEEELRQTKSYKSLKNWGHDLLKSQGKKKPAHSSSSPAKSPPKTKPKSQKGSPSKPSSKQNKPPSKSKTPTKASGSGSGSSKTEEKPKTPKKSPQKQQQKTPGSSKKPAGKEKATPEKSPLKQKSEKSPSVRQTRSSDKTKGDEKRQAEEGPTNERSPKKTRKE
ncbi:Protein of unknown function DUF3140 [Phaffia rhodozyma]|uniref:DNA-binding protein n=1 Tax=Phaffia rhodozyma TaxID=264483 RepID=A0A0F7SGM3_PHARH|nr:Protein of unknown function DUF3140 [Phaffia rhodozyma]